MAAVASCLALPCSTKPFSLRAHSTGTSNGLPFRSPAIKSVAFGSNLSLIAFPRGTNALTAVERPTSSRRSVVCEAAPKKKADSAAKRARQAEKRRIYNKARKSEIKTRMKKVFEALDVVKKKSDAQAEEILPIEKLIAEAYSVIDKAVKVGTLHRNTGAHRKSRLARRKKAVEIHHGWYTPVAAA
ncbi:small ribosomal subunit protein bS20c [Elaeis guineensis]|uniref:Small ribosomal subunit protein bS20c n=1 Tax=Elaeis guineensis var. tenera TaxID=51953 RepID=A0A6I9QZI9_ELAGV|nr:30S ribosomal protein S20, chloroplastic [Elaeis guineensis]